MWRTRLACTGFSVQQRQSQLRHASRVPHNSIPESPRMFADRQPRSFLDTGAVATGGRALEFAATDAGKRVGAAYQSASWSQRRIRRVSQIRSRR